ncbi:DNA-binding transcriptional regulator, LysR family [Paenibacillus tianmuensis]|uniref:DNA-binding transcriptional regulator, LysR family n=1 Tax=Paenibacillus tianmuensis TaxID=624147 RepID=A0A1G4T9M9_9BACL|nr:LysR family transcriptional regulator [Paenibacillus tianmuensis]SCW78143.1 DNA-binding transcriptional regulator, LysR family [Paenibacillus tianmuensis]
MSFVRFEVFIKVVEYGSFTKAAEKLNMTQSAVSHAIASLESELGATLLIRDRKKGVLLTEVGHKLVIHMREILNSMEKIKQEVALTASLETGTIRIGTFASASSCLLPKILSKFQKKHPNIEFRFYEGSYEEITEWLRTGVIDIGFVVQQNSNPEFDVVPLTKDNMVLAFPANHKFSGRKDIAIEELGDEPFIMPTGMYQSHILDIFQEAKIKPNIRFEVYDCTTIANMVQEGLGVTIGPELFLKTQPHLQIGSLNVSKWRTVALACPSFSSASPAAQAFLTVAQNTFDKET